MTAEERFSQLELLVAESLGVLDRHTAQLKQLQNSVGQLITTATQHSDTLSFLLREQLAMKGDIAEIKSDIAEMKGGIVEMKGDIVEMNGGIVEMKGDIVEMKGDIVEMKGDIVEMKGDIVEMKGGIVEMNGDIVEMKGKLDLILNLLQKPNI